MTRTLFISLPVRDLAASTAFYQAIGFTPNLDYLPARAETFWGYYRGMNPLFDDLFAGRGFFLCQQVSAAGDAARARKFWAGLWGGTLKAFGL